MKLLEQFNVTINESGVVTRLDGRIYSQCKDRYGYTRVYLTDVSGKRSGHFVHRLLAQAYIPNPENKRCVNHIDGNKSNNSLDNLEWCSHKENTQHAIKLGLFIPEKSYCKAQKVRAIKELYATGKFTQDELAEAFECTQANINRHLNDA